LTVRGLLGRFGAAYLLLLVILGLALNLFGVKANAGVNTAALLGAVMWVCMAFGRKNGRYLARNEKTRAVLGMIAIDLAIQAAVSVSAALAAGAALLQLGPMLLVLLFVGLLHAGVIYFFVGMAGRQFAAAEARRSSRR